MFNQWLVPFLIGFIPISIVGLCIWWRERRRQAFFDQLVFKPPAVVTHSWPQREGDSARVTLLKLTFGPPESSPEKRGNATEVVDMSLIFTWDGTKGKYHLAWEEIEKLLKALINRGIGKKWNGVVCRSVWHAVEGDVSAYILQHEAAKG